MKTTLQLYSDGDEFFRNLREAISRATRSLEIELYYFANDAIGLSFGELLKKKASEGVSIRMIYDAVGCRGTPTDVFDELNQHGILAREYNPLFPPSRHFGRRNHRKTMIIDRQIGFLGGFNLASEYSRERSGEAAWRDSGARVEDPELVQDLSLLFEDSWNGRRLRARDFIKRRVPRPDWRRRHRHILANHGWRRKSLIREEYLSAIVHAQKFIAITNPYFIPDRGIRRALRRAARRGVDVRLLTAGPTDVRVARWAGQATFSSFLRAGVRIYEYQDRVLHAKTAVIDDHWLTVGTSNIDHLSFFRNLEVNLFVRDDSAALEMTEQFEKDLLSSKEVLLPDWRKRSWFAKLREKFFFFFRVWL